MRNLSERKIVGPPLNFRGLVYGPINEQGVVYLFSLVASDLNIRVESIQQGYPDCTAIRYIGKGKWERINIEFEYKSSNFDHDPDKCDVLVCWEDDLEEGKRTALKGLEIIALKSIINTREVPNIQPKDPEESTEEKVEYDLEYHFKRKNVSEKIRDLYVELDKEIRNFSDVVWVKYAQTAVTYYSPEKMFVYVTFSRTSLSLDIFTDQKIIEGVQNIRNHENWGKLTLKNRNELGIAVSAIKKSFSLMRDAIKNNKNTGWYALTPKDKRSGIEGEE